MNSLQNDFNIMVEECVRVQESFMRKGRVFCKEKGRTLSCFVYVLEGTAKYDFKNEKFIVNTGDIVSIIQNDTYSLEALGDTYHYIAVSYRVAKKDLIKFDTRETRRFFDCYSNELTKYGCEKSLDIYWNANRFSTVLYSGQYKAN